MTYTAPTDDDLTALTRAEKIINDGLLSFEEALGLVETVHERLAVPAPPPPPPDPALPAVGIGGSGAFQGMQRDRRRGYLRLARAAGITHFRFTVSWSSCEQVKGRYQFGGVLAMVDDILAEGLVPCPLVGWTPPAYRPTGTTHGANAVPDYTKGALVAWESFLRALFALLHPKGVRRYEIWNEPNFLFMQPVSPAVWADLVMTAHAVACDISRHIRIIAGGVCPAVDRPTRSMGASMFYDAVLDHVPEFFEFVDAVGIHPYAGNHTRLLDGQFWQRHVTYLDQLVPDEVPLCGTEHGWKSGPNTEEERAELYVDSILSFPDQREPLFIFSLFDFAELYGILTADGQPKPVYHALRDLLVTEG